MLKLKGIQKTYELDGGMKVEALKGIDLSFRESEFVSVLGPSGCGKTTLLNIIGGLDHPTGGELRIGGVSTAKYNDRDWDTYRNHSIGFVFQSYNLIPHMSVLANVELAPIIAGDPKSERRKKAVEALERVGLGDQLDKKPNQLSGGQMQRVAIARALVNNPEILLADEPTGALDTDTSVQIMEILKSISKDRLIIMVTHNPDLAKEYSSRIINLKDGLVTGDSDPYEEEQTEDVRKKKEKKASMSFFTALSLSMRNLMTKKARTFLTSFAGSIGIIGIAMILALSNGISAYIDQVQEDTLSAYPLTINKYSSDTTAVMQAMSKTVEEESGKEYKSDRIYPDDTMGSMMSALNNFKENDIPSFKKYYEDRFEEIRPAINAYRYVYDLNISVYNVNAGDKGAVMQINPSTIFDYMGGALSEMMSSMSAFSGGGLSFFSEMLEGVPDKDGNKDLINDVVKSQYQLVGEQSRWPENRDEIVLTVDDHNRISNMALYALGFKDPDEIEELLASLMSKEYNNHIPEGFSYAIDDFVGHSFLYVNNCDFYEKTDRTYKGADGIDYPVWEDVRTKIGFDEKSFLEENGHKLTIVGIVRQNKDATSASISSPVGYTAALADWIIEQNNESDIAKQQLATPEFDLFTGARFEKSEFTKDNVEEYLAQLSDQTKQGLIDMANSNLEAMITVEALPALLLQSDEAGFTALVRMMMPTPPAYTKEQTAEFLSSLSDEEKTALAGMLSASLNIPITVESLPTVLPTLPDEIFASIVGGYSHEAPTFAHDEAGIASFLEAIGDEGKAQLVSMLKMQMKVTEETLADTLRTLDDDTFATLVSTYKPETVRASYQGNMTKIGYEDDSRITAVYLYAQDFESKDVVKSFIKEYNKQAGEDHQVEVTDLVGTLLKGINTIIKAISYVLIAFVAISLVVSSIMIAIITYISVLERTKEIGILRSLGASKHNIRNVFNAETLIEGFCSGLLGVLVTLLLCMIANPILHALIGINNINAFLPLPAAIILILISMLLTFIAGLIPANMASKKDPVIALRTE